MEISKEVLDAIAQELEYQERKRPNSRSQSVPGYLLILRQELNEAEEGWAKNYTGRHSVMSEIVQIAATAIRAISKYGTSGCPISTDDIKED